MTTGDPYTAGSLYGPMIADSALALLASPVRSQSYLPMFVFAVVLAVLALAGTVMVGRANRARAAWIPFGVISVAVLATVVGWWAWAIS